MTVQTNMIRPRSESERQVALYNWLTPKQAAKIAGDVTVSQVIRWIDDGELQAMNVARRDVRRQFKIRQDWLDEFMDSRKASKKDR